VAALVCYRVHVEEQCVICAARPGIFDGNDAMDPVPFSDEDKVDALYNEGAAILTDTDSVFKVGDPPAAGMCQRGEQRRGGHERKKAWERESSKPWHGP